MSTRKPTSFSNWIKDWLPSLSVDSCAESSGVHVELSALEDRVLYSAVPFSADLLEHNDSLQPNELSVDIFEAIESDWDAVQTVLAGLNFEETESATADPFELLLEPHSIDAVQTLELLVIDRSVDNFQTLVNDVLENAGPDRHFEIRYLDSNTDGIAQLTQILSQFSQIDSTHLVTHGQDGELQLGNTLLNQTSLQLHQTEFASWNLAFTADADFLIYGCDVASTNYGIEFIEQFASLTGTDVAASSDLTGHADLGGDWVLEFNTGTVESQLAFSTIVQADWHETLDATHEVTASATPATTVENTASESRGSQQAVAMDALGNSVVVWSKDSGGGDRFDVFAQRFDRFGTAVGSAIQVNDVVSDDQQFASVAMDAAGNFVVTWLDRKFDDHINLKRFAADGTALTTELAVSNPAISGTAYDSTIAMNDSGAFVIAWVGDSGVGKDIYATVYNSAGTEVRSNFLVNTITAGDQVAAAVSINESGRIVISWHDDNGVHAQRFNEDGNDNGNEINVAANSNVIVTIVNDYSSVALQNDNTFAIAYNNGTNGNFGPEVKRYNSGGNFEGSMDPNQTSSGYQGDVSIQVGSDGNYLIVWEGFGNRTGEADTYGVYSRLYTSGGAALTNETLINSGYTTGNQEDVSAAILNQNTYAFVYSGESATDTQGVYFQFIGAANTPPTGASDTLELIEDQTYTFADTDFSYFDADGEPLDSINIVSLPIDGDLFYQGTAVTVNQQLDPAQVALGQLQYLPMNNQSGSNIGSFGFQLSDGTNWSTTQTISFDIAAASGTIRGTIYEDTTGDGTLTGDTGVNGATVRLYLDDGNGLPDGLDSLVQTVVTDNLGQYVFTTLTTGNYYVVVDSQTIAPNAGFNTGFDIGDVWAEQTFASAGAIYWDSISSTYKTLSSASTLFGGLQGDRSDSSTGIVSAEHVNFVASNQDNVTAVDFGFSFNVVTNLRGGDGSDDSVAADRTIQGSLRQFLQNANAISGGNSMRFVPVVDANETSANGDWWSIGVSVALPTISDAATILDGRAFQTDGVSYRNENTNMVGYAGIVGVGADGISGTGDEAILTVLDAPELEIYADGTLDKGIVVTASNVEISHLAIRGFGTTQTDHGNIFVDGSANAVSGVKIYKNILGSSAGSFAAPGTGVDQTRNISVLQADNGIIQNNVLGFADYSGILISGSGDSSDGANGWQILDNEIRNNGLVNYLSDGINIVNGSAATIVSRNLIADNAGLGIDTWNSAGSHQITENTISGNGFQNLETAGVRLFGTNSMVSLNLIHGNTGSGVHVVGANSSGAGNTAATGNLISKNSIYNNSGIGIDLGEPSTLVADQNLGDGISDNGVSANVGAGNDGLDHPELTQAYLAADGLHVLGSINILSGIDRIEFYLATPGAGDDLGGQSFGEGSDYLGSVEAASFFSYDPITGQFEAIITEPPSGWPGSLSTGEITAISIEDSAGSSEFSRNANVNRLPVFQSSDQFLVAEGTKLVGFASANDNESQPLTYSLVGGDDQPKFQLDPNSGKLEFRNSPNFEALADFNGDGRFEISVQADDGNGGVSIQLITVELTDVNEQPIGTNDSFTLDEGATFNSGTTSVLQNDTDPDSGDTHTASLVSDVAHGSLTLNSDGTFIYQHDGSETTSDAFTYRITDAGGLSSTAVANFTINPVDDPSVANPDSFVMVTGSTLRIQTSDLLRNDYDPDSSTNDMSVVIVSQPEHGTLTLAQGQLTYVPSSNSSSSSSADSFEYAINVNGVTGSTATVTISQLPGTSPPRATTESKPADENPDDKDDQDDFDLLAPPVSGGARSGDSPLLQSNEDTGSSQNRGIPADTFGNEVNGYEITAVLTEVDIFAYSSTYDFDGGVEFGATLFQFDTDYRTDRSNRLSQLDSTFLAAAFWENLDEAKQEFLMEHWKIGPTFAASTASFLTVGYLAWLIRGGVLLTTFMSSLPAWNALDIMPVLESANLKEEDDESIEQMVDI